MRHRAFHPLKFCAVVEPAQLQRLLESFAVPSATATRLILDHPAFEAFCDEPSPDPGKADLIETLQRVNDLAEASLRFVVNEYQRAEIRFDADHSPERLAIRLYLDYRPSFEAAWSNYVLFGTTANLASYRLVGDVPVSPDSIAVFAAAVRAYFAEQAKGEHCEVFRSDNETGVVVRIDHGLHMQTLRHWEEGRPRHLTVRPAKEDVLFYETRTGLLHIRASLEADRDAYLRLFARDVAGDETLAQASSDQPLYTLAPLSFGQFSLDGNGQDVLAVQLRQLRMRLYGAPDTVLTVGSKDVGASFAQDLAPLSPASGDLIEARFRMHVWPKGGRPTWVSVTVKPPARTALTQAKYSTIVERYLEAQGVRIP